MGKLREAAIGFLFLTVLLSTPQAAIAQTPEESHKNKPSDLPRLADGHPNLQGLWHNESGYQAALKNLKGGGGLAVALGDFHSAGVPLPFPYWPITKQIQEYRDLHDPYHDPEAHCHLPGVPREIEQPSSLFPFRIIQDEKYVVILYEYTHDVRIIPEDGSSHPQHYWAWDGDSRGHWEGDTLVVDVTNFNGRTWLDMEANFVDENEHVVERYTMTSPDTITYAATVEDPSVFTKPWTMELELKRNPAKDQIVYYDCHEGERDVEHYPKSEGNAANPHD